MHVRIRKRENGMYDVYNRMTGQWILSRMSPDNILSYLSDNLITRIDFIDETLHPDNTNAVMTQDEYINKLLKDNENLNNQLDKAYEIIGSMIDR